MPPIVLPPQLRYKPTLRLHIDDISHPAAQVASSSLDAGLYLTHAIEHVITQLYAVHGSSDVPKVRSVTVVLRSMGGVAYTTGLPLDELHKEIHLSLDYVQGVLSRNSAGVRHELAGVITHEMVHCFQGNCEGSVPGGLIEGIADFVRLKAGLAPPHWKRVPENMGHKWDEGYQKTAWFLEWLEDKQGQGTVSQMNDMLGRHKYHEETFWRSVFGKSVDKLWAEYKQTWDESASEVPPQSDKHGAQQESQQDQEPNEVVIREEKKPLQFNS